MQDYLEKALSHMRLRLENGSGALLTPHETKAIIAALSIAEPAELRGLDLLIARVSSDLEMLQDTSSSEATLNDIGGVLAMLQHLRGRFSYLPAATPPAPVATGGAAEADLLPAVFAAIEEWEEQRECILDSEDRSELHEYIAAALQATPAAKEAAPLGGWVAVGTALPTDWHGTLNAPMVLMARTPGPYVDPIAIGYLYDGEWFAGMPGSDENLPVNDVTHWMPLPLAPAHAAQ